MEFTSVSYVGMTIPASGHFFPLPPRFLSRVPCPHAESLAYTTGRREALPPRHRGGKGSNSSPRSALFGIEISSLGPRFPENRCLKPAAVRSSYSRDSGELEDDSEEFLEVQVVEAVRMIPSQNRLYMTMMNGKEVEVMHVNPMVGRLLYEDSTPTIFLKLKHSPELMLPICVGELAVGLLMKGFKKEHGTRPNCYELLKNLVNILKYEVRMVRVTQRVVDTYYARIYLSKPGDDTSNVFSVDARPSDAINLAVRCRAPIFVSKSIILSDAVRISAYDSDHDGGSSVCSGEKRISEDMDVSSLDRDPLAEEVLLMKRMHLAAEEERYDDAAQLRDELMRLRNGFKGKINF